ncbi:MAG: hypothetical protein O3B70_04030 [Bacteroidetes bacterium]|nr:hypothetical protein [Bacteroidota bacterium]
MSFDGTKWELSPLPNSTMARSLALWEDQITVGGQGIVAKRQAGGWANLTAELQNTCGMFEDVWRLEVVEHCLFIVTNNFVARWPSSGKPELIQKGRMTNGFVFDGDLHFQRDQSLWQVGIRGEARKLFDLPPQVRMECALKLEGTTKWVSHAHGMFVVGQQQELEEDLTSLSRILRDFRVNCMLALESMILLGTSEGGVVLTSDGAHVDQIWNTSDGLAKNNVLSMALSREGDVWLGMEGGVSLARWTWPQRIPQVLNDLDETGATSLHLFDGTTYWGTSQGLVMTRQGQGQGQGQGQPVSIDGVFGQVWSLEKHHDEVWCCHLSGAGIVQGTKLVPVIEGTGVWTLENHPTVPDVMIAGTFEGLRLVKRLDGQWLDLGPMQGFEESARLLAWTRDTLWVAHPYKGLHQLALNLPNQTLDVVRHFDELDGLPQPLNVGVVSLDDELIVTTGQEIWHWNASTSTLEPLPEPLPGFEHGTRKLWVGPDRSLWGLQGSDLVHTLAHREGATWKVDVRRASLLPTPPVEPFEQLEWLDSGDLCIPTEDGFTALSAKRMLNRNQGPNVRLTKISWINGEASHEPSLESMALDTLWELPSGEHTLQLELTCEGSRWVGMSAYQWRLPQASDGWSPPQSSPSIVIGGLGAGRHLVEFRAIAGSHWEGPTSSYVLSVRKPWWAHAGLPWLATVLSVSAIAGWGVQRRRRLREEHTAASEEAQAHYAESLAEAEKARRQSELANARAQLANQNQELASATLHLVEKAQLVKTLEEGLTSLARRLEDPKSEEIKPLLDLIANSGRNDESWEVFSAQFNKVHLHFTSTLKAKYPGLTPNDVKLCTYLKINLSSKDISSLMFISVRAVEVSRSRLRKRMKLGRHESLSEVIANLTSEN